MATGKSASKTIEQHQLASPVKEQYAEEELASTNSADVISLGEVLTVKTVAEYKKQIAASLAQNADVKLDSGCLQKIDTAGLQMLLSLQKSLAHSHQQINWKSLSPVIESAARLTGLTEIIDGIAAESSLVDEPPAPADNLSAQSSPDQGFGFF